MNHPLSSRPRLGSFRAALAHLAMWTAPVWAALVPTDSIAQCPTPTCGPSINVANNLLTNSPCSHELRIEYNNKTNVYQIRLTVTSAGVSVVAATPGIGTPTISSGVVTWTSATPFPIYGGPPAFGPVVGNFTYNNGTLPFPQQYYLELLNQSGQLVCCQAGSTDCRAGQVVPSLNMLGVFLLVSLLGGSAMVALLKPTTIESV